MKDVAAATVRRPLSKAPASIPDPDDGASEPDTQITITVRYRRDDVRLFKAHAVDRRVGFTTYMRECTITGDRFLQTAAAMQAHVRVTGT